MAFPDVCLVAAVPSPIPTPFPNIAQNADASALTCSLMVKFDGKAVVMVNSEIPMSSGDEAGKSGGGGVMSGVAGDKVVFKNGSLTVKVEGKAVALSLMSATAHNGASPNAVGMSMTPSQVKVMVNS